MDPALYNLLEYLANSGQLTDDQIQQVLDYVNSDDYGAVQDVSNMLPPAAVDYSGYVDPTTGEPYGSGYLGDQSQSGQPVGMGSGQSFPPSPSSPSTPPTQQDGSQPPAPTSQSPGGFRTMYPGAVVYGGSSNGYTSLGQESSGSGPIRRPPTATLGRPAKMPARAPVTIGGLRRSFR